MRSGSRCSGTQPGCFGPPGLQKLYNITNASRMGGKGVTVALIDAFGYTSAQADLAEYRKVFHLPPCNKACFAVVNQEGKAKPLPAIGNWEGEQALDIDMVSAICPNCKIILVEVDDNSTRNLAAGVNVAVKLGANIISNSYGCPEDYCAPKAHDSPYDHKGVVITASAGDTGAGAAQPCSLSTVICVGGTSVAVSSGGRGFTETVWDGLVHDQCGDGPCATGSGCSSIVAKPSWQNDEGCTKRSESDLSAVADPYTGVIVACTPCGGSPFLSNNGGTSAAAPMIAAMYALDGNFKTQNGSTLWAHQGEGFYDVINGTNSNKRAGTFVCPKSYAYICRAGTMNGVYSGPAGWGTPNGVGSL